MVQRRNRRTSSLLTSSASVSGVSLPPLLEGTPVYSGYRSSTTLHAAFSSGLPRRHHFFTRSFCSCSGTEQRFMRCTANGDTESSKHAYTQSFDEAVAAGIGWRHQELHSGQAEQPLALLLCKPETFNRLPNGRRSGEAIPRHMLYIPSPWSRLG